MSGAIWVLVNLCREGSLSIFGVEVTAREQVALLDGAGCGKDCRRLHTLVTWRGEP